LHDIVAHAVTVIVIQAQAGARALPDSVALAGEIFERIEASGRTALTELRGLLTLLADDTVAADTQPAASLGQIDELVQTCQTAGQQIELTIEGPLPPLSPVADLAAYRVVQEALTNTLRHAPGATTRLRLSRHGTMLQIEAEDDGGPHPTPSSAHNGAGRGLIGMRERLTLAGGHLVQAEHRDTGFVIRAEVPIVAEAGTTVREPIG
jgi:signal transduction histidine kinase